MPNYPFSASMLINLIKLFKITNNFSITFVVHFGG